MKRIITVIVMLVTLSVLVGCSSSKPVEKPKATETKTTETAKTSETAAKSDKENRDQVWKAVKTASAIGKAAVAKNIADVNTNVKALDEIIDPLKKLIKDESIKGDLSAEKIGDLAKNAAPDFTKIKAQADAFGAAAKKAIVQFSTKEVVTADIDKAIGLAKDIKAAADKKDKATFDAKVKELDGTIDPVKPAITAKNSAFDIKQLSAESIGEAVSKDNDFAKAGSLADTFVQAAGKVKALFN